MLKFLEITDKAEKLVESGEIAKREVQQCSARVSVASSQLQEAQRQLDQAKETDEDGKPKGNVSGAQSAVAVAQGKLAASRRALQDAKNKVSSINAQKKTQIRKIEAHNAVEKNNLSQLKKLQGLSFAGNTEAMYKGIVERMNLAEKAKASLNKSLGLDEDIEEESNEESFVSLAYDNDISITCRTKAGANSSLSNNTHNNNSTGTKYECTNASISNNKDNSHGKHGLVSSNGDLVDEKTIIDKYNNAKAAGDEDEMNKYRTLYEINSFYNEFNLTDGEEGVVQEGGLYKDLKTHEGYERHHIPSSAVQDKNKGKLPALTITKEDHINTDSYKWKQNKKNTSFLGESFEKYKVEASDMISNGEYAELVKAEVFNIIENNGHKYDGGLKGYFQALYTMIENEGVPQGHSYQENKKQDPIVTVSDNSPMGKLT